MRVSRQLVLLALVYFQKLDHKILCTDPFTCPSCEQTLSDTRFCETMGSSTLSFFVEFMHFSTWVISFVRNLLHASAVN